MKYFRAQFPLVKLNPSDTLHFCTEGFIPGTYDSARAKYFYDLLLDFDNEYNPYYYSSESFFRPVMRTQMNGQEIFVGECGDTNELSIYAGKDVLLFVYHRKKGFSNPFKLASIHAGEGPWFQTDSWFVDLNHDKRIDILTREIGSYMQQTDISDDNSWDYFLVDELKACTLNDTGFVEMKISNPDSLKKIYGHPPD